MSHVKYLIGKSATGKNWSQHVTTVSDLYSLFKKVKPIKSKDKAPWIVFASSKEPQRNIDAIGKFYGVIIDFDSTKLTIDEISQEIPWSHLIHSTHSHRIKPDNNYHLIIFLLKTIKNFYLISF